MLGILLAGGWAWAPDRNRAALATKYDTADTHYLVLAGDRLRVRDSGPNDAPAVVLMHGFGSSLETWDAWACALALKFRVVRFDFPGSGLSEADSRADYGDARTLQLVAALLDSLGINRAIVVGNSLGGRIAWKFAAAYPERTAKLILISPDGFASPGFEYGKAPAVPKVLSAMKYFLPKAMLRANLKTAYADPGKLAEPTVDRYYDLLLAAGNREAMLARMRQTMMERPQLVLRHIQTPTLLLWGTEDHMIPYQNSADYLREMPHVALVTLHSMGHVPHEESPRESLAPVMNFLGAF